MTDEIKIDPLVEEKDAIKRLAATRDGLLLHRYLRRILETVIDIEIDSALRTHNGRRTLARDLMRLMAEGINDNRTDAIDGQRDDPILARGGGSVRVIGRVKRDRRFLPRVDSHDPDGPDPTDDGADKA